MADTAVAMGNLSDAPSSSEAIGQMFRTLDDLDVKGKRVLVRADLNVPDGRRQGDRHALRIERQAPTIRELAEKGARVIVLSHFDRPKGKVVPSMSLKPLAEPLAQGNRPAGGFRRGLRRARGRKPRSRR